MSPKDVLLKAAALIRERGHAKRSYCESVKGCLCTYGAINMVVSGDPWGCTTLSDDQWEAGSRAFSAVRSLPALRKFDGQIVRWNDHPTTTANDVIAALEAAAELV